MKKTFDSYDLVLCVTLWGGYTTGFWYPAIFLFSVYTYCILTESINNK